MNEVCEHEMVRVWTISEAGQDWDRVAHEWCSSVEIGTVQSLDVIICIQCGEDVTDKLRQEIKQVI